MLGAAGAGCGAGVNVGAAAGVPPVCCGGIGALDVTARTAVTGGRGRIGWGAAGCGVFCAGYVVAGAVVAAGWAGAAGVCVAVGAAGCVGAAWARFTRSIFVRRCNIPCGRISTYNIPSVIAIAHINDM